MNNIFRSNLRKPSKWCVPSHAAREVSCGHTWYTRFIGLGVSQVLSIPERMYTKINLYNAAFRKKWRNHSKLPLTLSRQWNSAWYSVVWYSSDFTASKCRVIGEGRTMKRQLPNLRYNSQPDGSWEDWGNQWISSVRMVWKSKEIRTQNHVNTKQDPYSVDGRTAKITLAMPVTEKSQ
jgi:hypothetical protein